MSRPVGACAWLCSGGGNKYTRGHALISGGYALLWQERQLLSVANPTRQDGIDFLRRVLEMGIVTHSTTYPLKHANQALADLRAGRFDGAAVLVP